jgi:hypothetical protein
MRLAAKAENGYTILKLNYQNQDDDVTITQYLNTWKTKTLQGKFPNFTEKSRGQRFLPIVAAHRL